MFLGDSPCIINPFLLAPCNNTKNGEPEGSFSCYVPTSRTFVECGFGEIDSRWSVLLFPLKLKLTQNIKVIGTEIILHSFIVSHDLESGKKGYISVPNKLRLRGNANLGSTGHSDNEVAVKNP